MGFYTIGLFLACAWASPDGHFHEIKRHTLGGEGGWDYLTLDSTARRLYVTHSERVLVVDIDQVKTVGQIEGTAGVHGVALADDLGFGFTSNGKAGEVGYFPIVARELTGKIPVGQNPDAIVYDPATHQVFAFNGKSRDVSVIDARAKKVLVTIPLGAKPEFAVSDGEGNIFVDLEDKNQLAKIDGQMRKVVGTYSLKPCEEPSALAMDKGDSLLFVGCGNGLMAVVNAKTGKVLKTLPVGKGVDAMAYDAQHGRVFASAGEGKLSVFKVKGRSVVKSEDVSTEKGARTLAVDENTGNVYLVTAKFGAPAMREGKMRPTMVPGSMFLLVYGN